MRLFGTQVSFVESVLAARRAPVDAGPSTKARIDLARQFSKVVMQVVVSVFIMTVFIVVLLGDYGEDWQKAVFGFMGGVIGYWIR